MFGSLTEKFQNLFSSLSGKKVLTEQNMADAVRDVRLALLDADVNYQVASLFVKKVKEKGMGEAVLKSVTPGQQFIKLIHDELTELMGSQEAPLQFLAQGLTVFMVCGLQGSGKTTSCAKLAAYLQKTEPKKKLMLVGCDLQRPAAVDQLHKLADSIQVPFFSIREGKTPVEVAKQAKEIALKEAVDVLIVDTAGRLHIDVPLMEELHLIKKLLNPQEVLFVASAATGQDAVKVASEFDEKIGVTGTILTMLDGSARAGAAISIREVTKKPLKFEGIGEKVGDFQLFNPRSMADRILGMGDVINLVRKAEEHFDEKESKALEEKLRKASFTYDDYLRQMSMVKKMGSFSSLIKMIPGIGSMMGDVDFSDKEFSKTEAIILSMTPRERQEKDELTFSRKKRIAKGSGVDIETVNRLVKGFKRVKQIFKNMPDLKKMKGLSDINIHELQKQLGKKWH